MSGIRVAQADLEAFVFRVLTALGGRDEPARTMAEVIVWADLVGRYNHGVILLPTLAKRVQARVLDLAAKPTARGVAPCAASIDAGRALGHYAGQLAARHAIDLARAHGVGVVGVANSNLYGIGAYYVRLMAEAGMFGLALSNSVPKVAAHGGRAPVLGTNPFAFGVPAADGRPILFDISTAALAGSTVREYARKGLALPDGGLVDAAGQSVTDPHAAETATMLPMAGAKGFGLALLVEVLASVLTGAAMSKEVRAFYTDFSASGGNGHFFLALDVARWMPMEAFHGRMQALIEVLRTSGPEVRLPGEARWETEAENRQLGIPIASDVFTTLEALARDLDVALPRCRG